MLQVEIEGITRENFNHNFEIRKGDVILDVNFTMDIGAENLPLKVRSVSANRLVKVDQTTGEGMMILRDFSSQTAVNQADTAHSPENQKRVINLARLMNVFNYVIFGTILIMVIVFLAYNIDFSIFLIDYVRVGKLLHRIGLVNVRFPFLIELFFKHFHNLL